MSFLPETYPLPSPPEDPGRPDQALDYLRRVMADPALREAITVSSGSLASTFDKIDAGTPPQPAKLRRATFASMRYLSRMAHRSTPFGLLAGVCPVRFDEQPKIRVGGAHVKAVRADYGWLTSVLRPLRTDPGVLPHLHVVANDLCRVRDDRLVLPYPAMSDELPKPRDWERSVRHTSAVALAMETARTPVRYPDLLGVLRARFPDVDSAVIERSLAGLIEQEFLRTDLIPPPTATDPLRYALGKLAALEDHPVRTALADVDEAVRAYEAEPVGSAAAPWRRLTARMRALRSTSDVVQVDLRMDAELTLPDSVRDEIAAAATVARRLRPDGLGPVAQLADYRNAFTERYGDRTLVPVKELLDPSTGLGPPAHYGSRSGHKPPDEAFSERDGLLCGLAQHAAAAGRREIVLDDELVERLAQRDAAADPGAYAEVCAELLAEDDEALRTGDFRLVLTGSYGSRLGAMYGRFLYLLPDLAEPVAQYLADEDEEADESADDADDADDAAVPAQVGVPLGHARMVNVKLVPPLSDTAISVGGMMNLPDAPYGTVLGLDDLAVTVDRERDRFQVRSLRDGREIVPFAPHALSLTYGFPPEARLLVEIGMERANPWQLWFWGAAEMLPYLPRVRYGRTVLANARWRPDHELVGSDLDWPEWRARWERWREQWSVPDVVYAVTSDNRIRVDLTADGELRMLRAELDRRPGTLLYERPMGGGHGRGWTGGHANEIVFSLRSRRRRRPAPARPPASRKRAVPAGGGADGATGRSPAPLPSRTYRRAVDVLYQPGGEWLYLKVPSSADLHDTVLARHLPGLVRRAEPLTDRWFFLRYREQDKDQLRLRFHGDPATLWGTLLGVVHDWLEGLRHAGLVGPFSIDGYRPEIFRYGGPEAIRAAEEAFAADSRAALEQVALRTSGRLEQPLELVAAANHLDLLTHLDPHGWRDWLLDSYPKDGYHRAFQTHRRRAIALLDRTDDWAALREVPGGERLVDAWRRRAPRVAAYGELIRGLVAAGKLDSATGPFRSILHLSHNRHAGIGIDAERSTYAILRGVAQAQWDRERHAS